MSGEDVERRRILSQKLNHADRLVVIIGAIPEGKEGVDLDYLAKKLEQEDRKPATVCFENSLIHLPSHYLFSTIQAQFILGSHYGLLSSIVESSSSQILIFPRDLL